MQVYKITNLKNSKVYIGLDSSKTHKRWKEHLRKYPIGDKVLYRAMRKYGIEMFSYETLEECRDRQSLQEQERFWIAHYNATDSHHGYNCTPGGDGGYTFGSLSEERRETLLKQLAANGHTSRVKSWVVEDYLGRRQIISNLRDFCRGIGIDARMLWSVSRGRQNHHKGWKCWALSPDGEPIIPQRVPTHRTMSKWILVAPDDTMHEVRNLKTFCLEHGLSYKQMHKVTSGLREHHRGYRMKDKSIA